MLSANEHAEIFVCILLVRVFSLYVYIIPSTLFFFMIFPYMAIMLAVMLSVVVLGVHLKLPFYTPRVSSSTCIFKLRQIRQRIVPHSLPNVVWPSAFNRPTQKAG